MKATLFYGPGDVRLEEIEIPKPGPGEVLVRVERALTCGTDIKTYQRGHPTLIKHIPSTFGHEFGGTIEEVGHGVENFRPGMRVVAANSAPCMVCFHCRRAYFSMCENLHYLNGAYAEYIVVPERIVRHNLYLIPDSLPFAEAALTEPLACALHAVERSPIHVGDTVAVLGSGPLGLMIAGLAHLKEAKVILSGKGEDRFSLAKSMGIRLFVDITQVEDQVRSVKELTEDSRGADVVIEAVGRPDAWEKAIQMARKAGHVNLFGGCEPGTKIQVDTKLLHYHELNIFGVYHHTPYYVRKALDIIIGGDMNTSAFISDTLPLSQLLEAFAKVKALEGIKYAIDPHSL